MVLLVGISESIGVQGEGEEGGDSHRLTLQNTVPLPKVILTLPIMEKKSFQGSPLPNAAKTLKIFRIFEKKIKSEKLALFNIFVKKYGERKFSSRILPIP